MACDDGAVVGCGGGLTVGRGMFLTEILLGLCLAVMLQTQAPEKNL